jgi:hypothetical protein
MLDDVRAQLPVGAGDDDVFFALFSTPDQIAVMHETPRDQLPVRELSPLGAFVAQLAARDDVTHLDVRIDVTDHPNLEAS